MPRASLPIGSIRGNSEYTSDCACRLARALILRQSAISWILNSFYDLPRIILSKQTDWLDYVEGYFVQGSIVGLAFVYRYGATRTVGDTSPSRRRKVQLGDSWIKQFSVAPKGDTVVELEVFDRPLHRRSDTDISISVPSEGLSHPDS